MNDFCRENRMEKDVNTEIRKFVLAKFPLARKKQVKDSDSLLESGIVDSQGVLEVVTFIEQEFSIVVADDDLVPENFQTIDLIAGYIRNRTRSTGVGSA